MTPEERAYAAAQIVVSPAAEPTTRRLSLWRVAGLFVLLLAMAAALVAFRSIKPHNAAVASESSFMPYVDVTATPQYPFESAAESSSSSLVLGFVVSAKTAACDPSWGGAYSLSQAATAMDLDRRIVRLRERGGQVAISFGGQANSELAVGCTDPTQLADAYRTVVDRYSVRTIDLDIEGTAASAPDVSARRAQAIHQLQLSAAKAGRPLQVWLTLPVDPSGLTASGRAIVAAMLAAKVNLAGVNALTMDYGDSLAAGASLTAADESALTHLSGQLSSAYTAAGQKLSAAAAWQRMGATPMIGQNDTVSERFSLDDAHTLVGFAQSHHLRRLSMWSVNRDQSCGPNYANVVDRVGQLQRRRAAGGRVHHDLQPLQGRQTASRHRRARRARRPRRRRRRQRSSTIPRPRRTRSGTPTSRTRRARRSVWHRNVYQAKWWTQGDTPDAPVATASDTPWTLVGPVLPGEHPQPTPTMSAGTYPQWSATHTYRAGDRVLYQGVGYGQVVHPRRPARAHGQRPRSDAVDADHFEVAAARRRDSGSMPT